MGKDLLFRLRPNHMKCFEFPLTKQDKLFKYGEPQSLDHEMEKKGAFRQMRPALNRARSALPPACDS